MPEIFCGLLVPLFFLVALTRGWCDLHHTWPPFLLQVQKELGIHFYSWFKPLTPSWEASILTTVILRCFYKSCRFYLSIIRSKHKIKWERWMEHKNLLKNHHFVPAPQERLASMAHQPILSFAFILPSVDTYVYLDVVFTSIIWPSSCSFLQVYLHIITQNYASWYCCTSSVALLLCFSLFLFFNKSGTSFILSLISEQTIDSIFVHTHFKSLLLLYNVHTSA